MPKTFTRRGFLVGCSAAIAAMAGARLTNVALAAPDGVANDEILIVVFIRGGWDALSVFPPLTGNDRGYYETARPTLKVPVSGTGAAIALNNQFGMHPSLAPLQSLYQAGKMSVVLATGLQDDTRSHFDAMDYIELGTPGIRGTPTGWLTRHLQSTPGLDSSLLVPVLSAGNGAPTSLVGNPKAIAVDNPTAFTFQGNWRYENDQRMALRHIYSGNTWLDNPAIETLNALDIIEGANVSAYTPASGATYPTGQFGDTLKTIAQMIKLDLGIRIATVDIGGWDTHQYEGTETGGYLTGLLGLFASGLAALYQDLDGAGAQNYTSRLTVVAMSEFGRRLKENAELGTDHGHGSAMMVLGGNVYGGKVLGSWPGLSNTQLYKGADLAITTDYRQVLSEIVSGRLGNPNINVVFPGYTMSPPLGVVKTRLSFGHATFVPSVLK
jgi:uncharacterized protein (DUF1501 family)